MIPGKQELEKKGGEAEKEGVPVQRDALPNWVQICNSQMLNLQDVSRKTA